jgi:hypothetical protein
MLLPLAAVAVTSCQDDPEWKPTWALPLVKDQTMSIGDFMEKSDVEEVNDRVRAEWKDYVAERFGLNDSVNVDSIAFVVLVDTTSNYVDYDADSIPKLNTPTDSIIRANLTENNPNVNVDEKIKQINDFLESYKKAQLTSSSSPSSGSYGGDVVVHNLLDAMIHPDDVFITAANLLSAMGDGYINSVNDQIDKVLEKANMTDTIAVNFAEYVGEDVAISSLELHLGVTNVLPFEVKLSADFIDDKNSVVNEAIKETTFTGHKECSSPPFDNQLDNIVKNTEAVKFSVKCTRTQPITEPDLRMLSKKTISFNLRVRIQAPMNKFNY